MQDSRRLPIAGAFAALAVLTWAATVPAHEIWLETSGTGRVGKQQQICVCWGHSGHRQGGETLKGQQSKLSAWLVGPTAKRLPLSLTLGSDCFGTTIAPDASGCYAVGAECQVGIFDREFHAIPANSRMVMYAKTLIYVPGDAREAGTPLGTDLELSPVGDFRKLRPGSVAAAKVSFKAAPIGGAKVVVSLSTNGDRPFPQDAEVEGLAWKVENNAQPGSGEVRFPLIVGGRHLLTVRYMDETPGRYDGDREFSTSFSHLKKGDAYERTLYVSTLTFEVQN